MYTADVLNVFANEDGKFGNPVGIIVDEGKKIEDEQRVAIAAALGFSESVFINDISSGSISIFTGQQEIAFAGHAAVGAAWYLKNRLGQTVGSLAGLEGTIEIWAAADDLTWVGCDLTTTPPWIHEFVDTVEALEAMDGAPSPLQLHNQLWTWIDEKSGRVRSRTFAPGWGIPEDEANGSGCMQLAACLGRKLNILHGRGSIINARPSGPGMAQVGGNVAVASSRSIE